MSRNRVSRFPPSGNEKQKVYPYFPEGTCHFALMQRRNGKTHSPRGTDGNFPVPLVGKQNNFTFDGIQRQHFLPLISAQIRHLEDLFPDPDAGIRKFLVNSESEETDGLSAGKYSGEA